MKLFIVHIVSIIIDFTSVAIFLVAVKKAQNTMHTNKELMFLGKDLMRQIAISSTNLDKAVSILKEEYEDICDENRKMDARVAESTRIRKEITKLTSEMELGHAKLKESYNKLQKLNTELEARANNLNIATKPSSTFLTTKANSTITENTVDDNIRKDIQNKTSRSTAMPMRNQPNALLQAINGGLPFTSKKIDEISEKEII